MRYYPVILVSLFVTFVCADDQTVGNLTLVLDSPDTSGDRYCYAFLDLFACQGWSPKFAKVDGKDNLCSREYLTMHPCFH